MFLLGAEETQAAPLVCALTGHIAREARRLAALQPGGRLDPPLTLVLAEAAQKVTVREGDKVKKMRADRAILRSKKMLALKGDQKAQNDFLREVKAAQSGLAKQAQAAQQTDVLTIFAIPDNGRDPVVPASPDDEAEPQDDDPEPDNE